MSGGGGSSRVPIPNNVRKTIQDIREITGKQHSDDDIYGVLKECSMDPNETAQKLLYLGLYLYSFTYQYAYNLHLSHQHHLGLFYWAYDQVGFLGLFDTH